MSAVELRSRRPEDGTIEVMGRVHVPEPGGPAAVEAADDAKRAFLESVLAAGVLGPGGRMLHLADGEAFVAALPQAIRGSRFWAVRVA